VARTVDVAVRGHERQRGRGRSSDRDGPAQSVRASGESPTPGCVSAWPHRRGAPSEAAFRPPGSPAAVRTVEQQGLVALLAHLPRRIADALEGATFEGERHQVANAVRRSALRVRSSSTKSTTSPRRSTGIQCGTPSIRTVPRQSSGNQSTSIPWTNQSSQRSGMSAAFPNRTRAFSIRESSSR
jgi:hypothetical protein